MTCFLRYSVPLFFAAAISLFLPFFSSAQAPALTIRQGLPGNNEHVNEVAFANGTYLASVVDPVRFFTSTDGRNWSRIAGPNIDSGNAADIEQSPVFAFGAGQWVVVSNAGKIFSSPDLLTWTQHAIPTATNFDDLKFIDGFFYAIGDNAGFYTSPDGLNWTAQTTGLGSGAEVYFNIAAGNGHLAISSPNLDINGGSAVVYVSDNGVAGPWVSDTVNTGNIILEFVRGRFYALGGHISVSPDAKTWTPTSAEGTYVFSDSNRVYLLGVDNAGDSGTIASASDGINFSPPVNISAFSPGAFLNGLYFVAGPGMIVSTDAVNWHRLGSYRPTIASDGKTIVKVSATPGEGFISTSTDFNVWTPRDTIATGLTTVLYDSTRFVAGGPNVYASTDGISWANVGTPQVPFDQYFHFVYGNGTYVGYWENDPVDAVWYSRDAVNWFSSVLPTFDPGKNNPVSPNLIGHISSIRYLNGLFWLLTSNINDQAAGAWISADGSDFTKQGMNNSWQNGFVVSSYSDLLYIADSAKYFFFGTGGVSGAIPSFFSVSTPNPLDSTIALVNSSVVNGIPPGMPLTDGVGTGTSGSFNPTDQGGFYFTYSRGHFIGSALGPGNAVDPNVPPLAYLLWSSDGVTWDNKVLHNNTKVISSVVSGDSILMEGMENFEFVAVFPSSPGSPLPVGLLDFNAVLQNDNRVLLTWATASEQNSKSFVIERSTDATNWTSIGKVAAAGNSSTELHYQFTDALPVTGYDYYRLLQTDLDGRSQLSEVKRVQIGASAGWAVFPNPATDHLTVEARGGLTGIITLYDEKGTPVLARESSGSAIILPLAGLAAGVYYVVIVQPDGSRYQQKILHTKN
jgi:hypothetical protein